MKGLASTSPAFAKVGISGRSARKHCGLNVNKVFLDFEHDPSRKHWDAFDGFYRIQGMDWLIKKVRYPFCGYSLRPFTTKLTKFRIGQLSQG